LILFLFVLAQMILDGRGLLYLRLGQLWAFLSKHFFYCPFLLLAYKTYSIIK
jgi:hypothetical protein